MTPNDGGDLISAIIASDGGDRITDVDPGLEGIAIGNLTSGNGTWQYEYRLRLDQHRRGLLDQRPPAA